MKEKPLQGKNGPILMLLILVLLAAWRQLEKENHSRNPLE